MRYVLAVSMVAAMVVGCGASPDSSMLPASGDDAGTPRDGPAGAGRPASVLPAAGSGAVARASAGGGGGGAAAKPDADGGISAAGRAADGGGRGSTAGATSVAAPQPTPSPPLAADDAGVPGSGIGVDVGAAVDCSFEFSACVLRKLPAIDECIDALSTCDAIIESAGDAGPDAACALQFSACVLDDLGNLDRCIATFETCRKDETQPD